MLERLLKLRLEPIARRQRRWRRWLALAACWGAAALFGLGLMTLERLARVTSVLALPLVAALGIGAVTVVLARLRRLGPDWRRLACQIEARHPELEGRLLTAVQQEAKDGELNYLQERLLLETLRHGGRNRWAQVVPKTRMALFQLAHALALALFVAVLWGLRTTGGPQLLAIRPEAGLTVTPGDTSLERGSSLVVMARFGGRLPASVDLVVSESSGASRRAPLVKSLADPVFGGSVPEVTSDLVYHLEYAGQRTRDFKVSVFDYPRLERADAQLTYPDYTGLAPKRIENTRRLSAVEGSRLDLTLQLNKPVAAARLVTRDKDRSVVPLAVQTGQAAAALKQFPLTASKTYELQLVDAEGRSNKTPAQFVFDVLKNRPPELKVASPRGDTRPSALEEMSFAGTAWDDFGVLAHGFAYSPGGKETKFVEVGRGVPAKQKQSFQALLRLEDLGAQPDDLITWFVWADDIGPDGQVRRTMGDLFFAEVRPFEEIFREGQSPSGGADEQREQEESGEQAGGQAGRLAELQKQILSATWKLQREGKAFAQPRPGADGPVTVPAKPTSAVKPDQRMTGAACAEGGADIPVCQLGRLSSLPATWGTGGWKAAAKRLECGGLPALLDALQSQSGSKLRALQTLRAPGSSKAVFMASAAAVQGPAPAPAALQVFGQRAGDDRATGSASAPAGAVRRPPSAQEPASRYAQDAAVVRDAQAQALDQAQAAKQRQQNPRTATLWDAAVEQMELALAQLRKATDSPAALASALGAEQAAYQALLKLQEREYSVVRSRRGQRGSRASREQQMQRQLDELELTQAENRYETVRQAQAPPSAERREQLALMNQLQELARRQQDLNDRLKELQTALQEARTEPQREEIRRQLKRLQEQEQQMLADVDELRQRLDRPENQSRLAEPRRQLEQTRNDVQRAAEAAAQGAVSQALASGTRAQRQMQQLRDDLRQESAGEFAEELRQMRAEARELARQQEAVQKNVATLNDPQRRTLSDSGQSKEALEQLAQQRQRLTNLVERATQVSQQTEEAEPLVSRELYEALRKFSQDDLGVVKEFQEDLLNRGMLTRDLYDRLKQTAERGGAKALELTAEMLRQGYLPHAGRAEERARAGINDLKRGVERAAERVLGDDTEALRLAGRELDQLTGQLEREIAQAEGRQTNGPPQEAGTRASSPASERERGAVQASPLASKRERAGAGASPPASERERAGAGASPPASERERAGAGASPPASERERGAAQRPEGQRTPAGGAIGGNRFPIELDRVLEEGGDYWGGPITGENFAPWSDRLREVEELVDLPSLRNDLARARERARQVRQEYRRDLKKPDWATVRLQIVKPLVEVRQQISDELARRDPKDNLAPIDRDPVPSRYAELVRRYYEQLGKDR